MPRIPGRKPRFPGVWAVDGPPRECAACRTENAVFRLSHDADRLLIAEDHHLTGVFNRAVATPVQLGHEGRSTDIAFDITQASADDLAVACGFGAKHIGEVGLGGEVGILDRHGTTGSDQG
jgi:hypothetical protein